MNILARVYSQHEFSDLNDFFAKNGLPIFKSMPERITWSDPVTEEQEQYKIDEQWFLPRSDLAKSKMFYVIQKFRTDEGGRIRIGYYKIGERPRFKGKWAWGESCPWYRYEDLGSLLPLLKSLAQETD